MPTACTGKRTMLQCHHALQDATGGAWLYAHMFPGGGEVLFTVGTALLQDVRYVRVLQHLPTRSRPETFHAHMHGTSSKAGGLQT